MPQRHVSSHRFNRISTRAFPGAQVIVRGLVQGPPVDAPVEITIKGQDIAILRQLGDEVRAISADLDLVTQARAGVNGGAPQVRFQIDEVKARLLSLDVADVAAQLNTALVGVTGGSLVEGTEQLPIRVRMGDGLRADLHAIADMPILLPNAAVVSASGAFPAVPLSELAKLVIEPSESVITRTDGIRENTVQAFIVPDVLPEEALQRVLQALDDRGFELPPSYSLELGGDSDARSNTVGNLLASLGLIVTLTVATIALTFNSFRLTAVALVVCVLSAGLSMLSLAIMQYPFGIQAIIGVIGFIGVSINAAIIILTGLQQDPEGESWQYRRHGPGCHWLEPSHHLDHHHDFWWFPASHSGRRCVLAAIRCCHCRRCSALNGGFIFTSTPPVFALIWRTRSPIVNESKSDFEKPELRIAAE